MTAVMPLRSLIYCSPWGGSSSAQIWVFFAEQQVSSEVVMHDLVGAAVLLDGGNIDEG